MTIFIITEKSGKTIHLLKSGSKRIKTDKTRKKIPIKGTFEQYQEQKQRYDGNNLQMPMAQMFTQHSQTSIPGHLSKSKSQVNNIIQQSADNDDMIVDKKMNKK